MRLVVLFGDGCCGGEQENTALGRIPTPNLDGVATRGVSGGIVMRNSGVELSNEMESVSDLSQLFGVFEQMQNHTKADASSPLEVDYSQRVHGMKLGFLSNDKTCVDAGKTMRLHSSSHVSSALSADDVCQRILRMLYPSQLSTQQKDTPIEEMISQLSSVRSSKKLSHEDEHHAVFYHCRSTGSGQRESVVMHLDQIAGRLLPLTGELCLVVCMSYDPSKRENVVSDQRKTITTKTKTPSEHFPPKQSYTLMNGNKIADLRNDRPVIVSYLCEGRTRKDAVDKYTEEQCLKYGANHFIAADHFMKELSYIMCFAPKYGA